MKPHQRYSDAHKLGFDTQYPQAAQAGHYFKPSMPDCRTANVFGLGEGYEALACVSGSFCQTRVIGSRDF